MISRHWRGVAERSEADNYINHLRAETFEQLARIDGFIGASILKREVEQGTEFLVITRWKSMQAVERFTGPAADVAVVPTTVEAMMIEYERTVTHYEVIEDYVPEVT